MTTACDSNLQKESLAQHQVGQVAIKPVVESFKKLYSQLTIENIDSIGSLYAQDSTFEDPFHQVTGIERLIEYFSVMYQNIEMINFEFDQVTESNTSFHINWTMQLVHPKLNKGQLVSVKGCSFVVLNETGMIDYHRDYFDAGAMLYEQLPIIRNIIKKIKKQF
jgi:hypothetical protein